MFEHLSVYDQILVTGPQRSGTTIAAKMIAADTGHRYVDEEEFCTHVEEMFASVLGERKIVVQCPAMLYIMDQVATESTLVVVMMRDCLDIASSEDRVGWKVGPYYELGKLGMSSQQARRYRHAGGRVAPLKYLWWKEGLRDSIPHWLELEYESLSTHPLWVPRGQRAHFLPRQTAL